MLQCLKISKYIFKTNYSDLINHLKDYKSGKKLYGFEESLRFQRTLFNFLSTCPSFRDHTYAFIERLKKSGHLSSEFTKEYESRKKVFVNDIHIQFIQNFINYAHHSVIPRVSIISVIQNDKPEPLSVHFNDSDIKNDSFSEKVKEYIISLNKKIDIEKEVSEYHKITLNFYKCFFSKFIELHKDKIPAHVWAEQQIKKECWKDAEIF